MDEERRYALADGVRLPKREMRREREDVERTHRSVDAADVPDPSADEMQPLEVERRVDELRRQRASAGREDDVYRSVLAPHFFARGLLVVEHPRQQEACEHAL